MRRIHEKSVISEDTHDGFSTHLGRLRARNGYLWATASFAKLGVDIICYCVCASVRLGLWVCESVGFVFCVFVVRGLWVCVCVCVCMLWFVCVFRAHLLLLLLRFCVIVGDCVFVDLRVCLCLCVDVFVSGL